MNFFKTAITASILGLATSANGGYSSVIDFGEINFDKSGLELFVADKSQDVIITYLGHSAGYKNRIYLDSFQTDYLFSNRESRNTVNYQVNLGNYNSGTNLDFKLTATNTGKNYFLGLGSNNPDGLVHAGVDINYFNSPNTVLVGFEDLYNGGDKDFNDMLFSVSNVSVSAVPEPSTYAMMIGGLGLVGLMAARRSRKKQA